MSKAIRRVMGWRESNRVRRMYQRYWASIPKEMVMKDDDLTELLARMWIDCDPNREKGTGDEPITLHDNGAERPAKKWEWFVPRAEATKKYLAAHGLKIVPAE